MKIVRKTQKEILFTDEHNVKFIVAYETYFPVKIEPRDNELEIGIRDGIHTINHVLKIRNC